jgi:hypothetical protein
LHSCIWKLFVAWILVVLFYRWCRALLPHLEESAIFGAFYLGCGESLPLPWGTEILLTQVIFSWLLFGFWSLVWVFRSFLFFFSFLWIGYMCVLSIHSSRGRLRTGASEDWWMVAPGCDECLTTWCGLTLGRVLQVQVAAWFALV